MTACRCTPPLPPDLLCFALQLWNGLVRMPMEPELADLVADSARPGGALGGKTRFLHHVGQAFTDVHPGQGGPHALGAVAEEVRRGSWNWEDDVQARGAEAVGREARLRRGALRAWCVERPAAERRSADARHRR